MDAIYVRQDIIQVLWLVSAMLVSQAGSELRVRQAVQPNVHNALLVNMEALVPVLLQITFAYFARKVFLTTWRVRIALIFARDAHQAKHRQFWGVPRNVINVCLACLWSCTCRKRAAKSVQLALPRNWRVQLVALNACREQLRSQSNKKAV